MLQDNFSKKVMLKKNAIIFKKKLKIEWEVTGIIFLWGVNVGRRIHPPDGETIPQQEGDG